jgi:L-threonylcarbamoyladenylate synthase
MTQSNEDAIAEAAAIVRSGGLVAMPTETVYGLAADATNDRAVARIFEAKGRPSFNPLIVHVDGVQAADVFVRFDPLSERLAAAFWPGPLTLVLPRRENSALSLLVSAGLDTVAMRSPAHPLARALLKASGRPLAAPSANLSGTPSPTTAAHVRDSLGPRVDLVLDGGACSVGIESTIVKIDGGGLTVLRPGGVATESIERAARVKVLRAMGGRVEAPGMTASHYAPKAALRLNVDAPQADEAFLAFGPAPSGHRYVLQLSAARDVAEAASNFFAHLRAADALVAARGLEGIAAAPIPISGLGEAINDRLARAAAPQL